MRDPTTLVSRRSSSILPPLLLAVVTLLVFAPAIGGDLASALAEFGDLPAAILLYQSALPIAPDLEIARRGLVLAEAAQDRLTTFERGRR